MYIFLVGLVVLMLFGMYQVLETRTVCVCQLYYYYKRATISVGKMLSLNRDRLKMEQAYKCDILLSFHLFLYIYRKGDCQWKLRRAPAGWMMWISAGFLKRLSMSWVCPFFYSNKRYRLFWDEITSFLLSTKMEKHKSLYNAVLQTGLPLKHLQGNEPTGQLEQINKKVRYHLSPYLKWINISGIQFPSWTMCLRFLYRFSSPVSHPESLLHGLHWSKQHDHLDTDRTELQSIVKGIFFFISMCLWGDKR